MNYYEFERSKLQCKHCQWEGLGRETEVLETFNDLAEYACPRCKEKVAVVMYPTLQEARENWDDVSPLDRRQIEIVEARALEFKARSLKRPDQLPDIGQPSFVLVWDDDGPERGPSDTVIRLGDRVIWREPAFYEGYWRFDEIAKMLRTKYGSALQDLEPTRRSWLNLYGDRLGSPNSVMTTRNALRALAEAPLPPLTSQDP